MFDHVGIRAGDRDTSERFFDTVLPCVGLPKSYSGADFAEWGDFAMGAASPERPVTRYLHIAFFVPDRCSTCTTFSAGPARVTMALPTASRPAGTNPRPST